MALRDSGQLSLECFFKTRDTITDRWVSVESAPNPVLFCLYVQYDIRWPRTTNADPHPHHQNPARRSVNLREHESWSWIMNKHGHTPAVTKHCVDHIFFPSGCTSVQFEGGSSLSPVLPSTPRHPADPRRRRKIASMRKNPVDFYRTNWPWPPSPNGGHIFVPRGRTSAQLGGDHPNHQCCHRGRLSGASVLRERSPVSQARKSHRFYCTNWAIRNNTPNINAPPQRFWDLLQHRETCGQRW